jgi:hypothetical protein
VALAGFAVPVALRGREAAAELAARRAPTGAARVIGERSGSAPAWAAVTTDRAP